MVAARVSPTCFPVAAGVMGRGAMMVLTVLALKLTSHARVSIGRNVVCSCFSASIFCIIELRCGIFELRAAKSLIALPREDTWGCAASHVPSTLVSCIR